VFLNLTGKLEQEKIPKFFGSKAGKVAIKILIIKISRRLISQEGLFQSSVSLLAGSTSVSRFYRHTCVMLGERGVNFIITKDMIEQ